MVIVAYHNATLGCISTILGGHDVYQKAPPLPSQNHVRSGGKSFSV